MPKSKVISLRVNIQRYELLKGILKEINKGRPLEQRMTMSQLINELITYVLIAYTLGIYNEPLPVLKKRFEEFLNGLMLMQKMHTEGKSQQTKRER